MKMKTQKKTTVWAVLALAAVLIFSATSCLSVLATLPGLTGGTTQERSITNAEAVQAMREALVEGTISASSALSAKNGYFGNQLLRILLPPEAKPILDNVSKIPYGQKGIDDVVLRLNTAAEHAAKDVMPIFKKAITNMTIADGIKILKEGDGSATAYFKEKTTADLTALYKPIIQNALNEPLVMDISAQQSWTTLKNTYNKAGALVNAGATLTGKSKPMPPVDVELADWATQKALDGLFFKVAEEETNIRKNPLNYTSKMIQRVFGALKDGKL